MSTANNIPNPNAGGVATSNLNTLVPGLPDNKSQQEIADTVAQAANLYVFYYRHGVNPGLSKIFYFSGGFKEAKSRAEKHCGIMGYKFIWIRPFIVDLDAEESTQLSRS